MKPIQLLKQWAALRTAPDETNTAFETANRPENDTRGSRNSLRNYEPT
jgi:hypothetical protein